MFQTLLNVNYNFNKDQATPSLVSAWYISNPYSIGDFFLTLFLLPFENRLSEPGYYNFKNVYLFDKSKNNNFGGENPIYKVFNHNYF